MDPTEIDQKLSRKILARVALLPVALMLALAAVLIWQISSLLNATRRIDHADEVIARANGTEKLIIDMETGARGYLVTGKREFLQPYLQAGTQVNVAFDDLGRMAADNPTQAQRLEAVRSRYREWANRTEALISAEDTGKSSPARVDEQFAAKALMDDIRGQFASFIATEENLRSQRSQTGQGESRTAVIVSVALTLLFGGILAIVARRQLNALSASYGAALK
ncbi:MAG: CHASE3 domain-containing protein, partial [Blastocatellia bacterium]